MKKIPYFEQIIFLGLFIVIASIYYFGLFSLSQDKITDRFFLRQSPKESIVIVSIDDQSLNAIGRWPWSRNIFAEILPDLEKARTIGFDINFADPAPSESLSDAQFSKALSSSKAPVVMPLELRADGQISVKPLDMFASYAALGFANMSVDADGVVRKVKNRINTYQSLSAVLSGKNIFIPEENRIHYMGPAKTFLTIPFIDVYRHKIPPHIFEGATVLIGATAADLHDFVATPFGMIPGVEVHANNIETLRTSAFLKDIPFEMGALIIFIFNLLSALSISKIKRFSILSLTLVFLFIGILTSAFVFFHFFLIFPTLYAILGFVFSSAFMLSFHYIKETSEKRFIRNTFQYYLSGDVIEELVKNPAKLKLGGERRRLTIFFSDVRDFTTISESMSPEELTSFMTDYFDLMSETVMDRRGVIDKYIGDAVMAFWGAPLENPTHAEDSCRVALSMISKLDEHNLVLKEKGLPLIHIGIGLNTGEVVVGNMGSRKRFNYTILGDEVNFTSRLEGITKEYGTTCIISESTKKEIENIPDLYTRELDEVLVKGKNTPKKIFELRTVPKDSETKDMLIAFEEGRKLYTKGDWKNAIKMFEKSATLGDSKTSTIFIERCHYLIANPPEAWKGVYQFKTK